MRRGTDTRRKVEEAAGRLFNERGYQRTTMQAIADDAGVHVQTIYLAYGTKAAVLSATATRLVAGGEDPASHPSDRRWVPAIQATPDPARKLRLYVRHIRDVAPRITRLVDTLRAAAAADPDVAAFLAHMQAGRREGPFTLLAPLAAAGQLRPGLTSTPQPTSPTPLPAPTPSGRSSTTVGGARSGPRRGSPISSVRSCCPGRTGQSFLTSPSGTAGSAPVPSWLGDCGGRSPPTARPCLGRRADPGWPTQRAGRSAPGDGRLGLSVRDPRRGQGVGSGLCRGASQHAPGVGSHHR